MHPLTGSQLAALVAGAFCIITPLGVLRAAPIEGTTSGIFTNARPDSAVVSGVGTNVFTWGTGALGSAPNSLTFVGSTLFADFEALFPFGTLTFFNGETQLGTDATAVDLHLGIVLTMPSGLTTELRQPFTLITTPNIGTPEDNADFLFFPASFPDATFTVDGITYVLDLIGFGDVGGSGLSTIDRFRVLEQGTATVQLLGRITSSISCIAPASGVTRETLFRRPVAGCSFGEVVFGTVFQDEAGNALELFCKDQGGVLNEYALDYVPVSGTRLQVGRCPFAGGQNQVTVTHVGDHNANNIAECILGVFWRSTQPIPILPPDLERDWKTYAFYPQTGEFVLRHFASFDGPGGFLPDRLVKEARNIDILEFNPDPIPSGQPMTTIALPDCDVDSDGDCDRNDGKSVANLIGQCIDGTNYNELADADHDGCITPADERLLFGDVGFIDAVHCYTVRTARNTPKFVPVAGVKVVDPGFGDTVRFDVSKPYDLCAPAEKNGEGTRDAVTHLERYRITASKDEPKHTKQRGVIVSNELGTLTLDTAKPELLMVPTAKDAATTPAPPDPSAHEVDHFACYNVRVSRSSPKLRKGMEVTIDDQLTGPARRYIVKKPTRLCTPVETSGEAVKHADHLVCYRVRLTKGRCDEGAPQNPGDGCKKETQCGGVGGQTSLCVTQAKFAAVRGLRTNNQFGTQTLDAVKEGDLCLPSLRVP